MQGWGLQALASSTTPSQMESSAWHALLRTWTPPPHSLLHSDQRAQLDQPSAIQKKYGFTLQKVGEQVSKDNPYTHFDSKSIAN